MKIIKITGRIEAQLSSWHLQYVCKKANFLCNRNPLNHLPFRIRPSVFFTLTLFKYFSSGFFKYCGRLANHKKFIEIYSEIFKFVKLFQSETKNISLYILSTIPIQHGQIRIHQSHPNQTNPNSTKPIQTLPGKNKPDMGKP